MLDTQKALNQCLTIILVMYCSFGFYVLPTYVFLCFNSPTRWYIYILNIFKNKNLRVKQWILHVLGALKVFIDGCLNEYKPEKWLRGCVQGNKEGIFSKWPYIWHINKNNSIFHQTVWRDIFIYTFVPKGLVSFSMYLYISIECQQDSSLNNFKVELKRRCISLTKKRYSPGSPWWNKTAVLTSEMVSFYRIILSSRLGVPSFRDHWWGNIPLN